MHLLLTDTPDLYAHIASNDCLSFVSVFAFILLTIVRVGHVLYEKAMTSNP